MSAGATKLVVGCGYLGSRVAARWRDAGSAVSIATRSAARAAEFAAAGYTPLVFDLAEQTTIPPLPEFDTVLFAVGFDRSAGRTIDQVYVQGLQNVVAALPAPPRCFVYISTTGVYGEGGGALVDEETACLPRRPGGIASLASEVRLVASPCGPRAVILRLAGIYGPGRVPRRETLLAGEPIHVAPDSWLNLIHVDDAATAVLTAERYARECPERLPRRFVISDGQPVRREEYYREVARLAGAPPPTFAPPADLAERRAGSDKRVSNARMRAELGFPLEHPNYQAGLQGIFAMP
jgi:nucleoside-diphosphate-sugar epimerase